MNHNELRALKNWFSGFTKSFPAESPEDRRNYSLKVEHSCQVFRNIVRIAESVAESPGDVLLAGAVGLLHDTGRFPQYARYRTFRDSISVNHGKLGAETLSENRVLDHLPADEQEIIFNAVRFHNAFSLPDLPEARHIFFLKLIRDADKVDIWRVFAEYFETPEEERASAAGIGLPEGPGCSEEVLSSIFSGKTASLSNVRTLNDFKLLQLSWVFDLNFKASFGLLFEKGDIERIINALPQTPEVSRAAESVMAYAERKMDEGECGN